MANNERITQPAGDPEAILGLKDKLLGLWAQLPPEYQATMALVLLQTVMESEWGPWMREALELGGAVETDPMHKPFAITSVCRADLKRCFSAEEIAQFDDGDMKRLADKMGDWYVDQSFWTDLELAGRRILADKSRRE